MMVDLYASKMRVPGTEVVVSSSSVYLRIDLLFLPQESCYAAPGYILQARIISTS